MIEPALRLRRAIHNRDTLLARRILKTHPHLLHNPDHSRDGLGNSNLHLAARLGCLDICKLLLTLGHEQPTPALNEDHQPAIQIAAGLGHTEVVLLLCEANPETILLQDIRGRDAIMCASQNGHDTVLQILLTYAPGGAAKAVGQADVDGNTALHFASSHGHLLVLRTLLAAGAEAGRRNVWSWTAASYSATVQAEVYLKNLVTDVQKREKTAWTGGQSTQKRAAGVRLVEDDMGDGEPVG
ncbi:ankyrin [Thozetella sp. PMI_491]|nr:ankyrin [Thozetella sp. PMI_491]